MLMQENDLRIFAELIAEREALGREIASVQNETKNT